MNGIANEREYVKFIDKFEWTSYDDLSTEDQALIFNYEKEKWIPKINDARRRGFDDEYISAALHSLWQNYDIISDDTKIADEANISDESWIDGLSIYWETDIDTNIFM